MRYQSHGGSTRQARQRAFSLVELLVVIGIVALLIGILLPVVSKARKQAYKAACLSNIRQLGTAVLMYCQDNKGYFPTSAHPSDGVGYVAMNDDWVWWQANRDINGSPIAKYLGARDEALKRVLRCPADSFDSRVQMRATLPGQGPYLYSYNMNSEVGDNILPGPQFARTQLFRWQSPSRKIVLTENYEIGTGGGGWNYGTPLTQRHGRIPTPFPPNTTLYANGWAGVNVSAAFMDGHVDSVDQTFACDIYQNQPDVP